MKKRLLSILFIGLIVIGLTGCGSATDSNGEQSNSSNSKNSLASLVKIGDYVDYQVEIGKTYTASKEQQDMIRIKHLKQLAKKNGEL